MDQSQEKMVEDQWSSEAITKVEISVLESMLACRTPEAVEASICFARFLHLSGINNDNYSLFLKLVEVENHWVIDAVIGMRDPVLLLSPIQPNNYLILQGFKLLTKWHPGGIYHKTLAIVLRIMQTAFSSPKDGYKIYNVSINDVNNLGKHLNKELAQEDGNNNCILDILDRLGSLEGTTDDPDVEAMSRQANSVRAYFFDKRRKMEDVIPQVLLVKSDYVSKEVAPISVFAD